MKIIITLLTIPALLFAQFCRTVPQTLTEAELLLETGEIDTLCFERFRALLLTPADPVREGWREIEEIMPDRHRALPSAEVLRTLPDSLSKETLLQRFPELIPYAPLFTLSDSAMLPIPIRGAVSASVLHDSGSGSASVRSAVSLFQRTFTDITIREKEQYADLVRRELTLRGKRIPAEISAGNFQNAKRPLIWGYFRTFDFDDPKEQLLYGNSSTWNGGYLQAVPGSFRFETAVHRRGSEDIQAGFAQLKLGALRPELGAVHESDSGDLYIGSLAIADSADRFRAEAVILESRAFAGAVTGQFSQSAVRGKSEVWFWSDSYAVPFSSRYMNMQRRYGSPGKSAGFESHWRWRAGSAVLETAFDGEICDRGGRAEGSAAVRFPSFMNSSLRSRFSETRADTVNNRFWELTVRTVPKAGRFKFPNTLEQRSGESGWERISLSSGAEFTGNSIRPDFAVRMRLYRDGSSRSDIRCAAVHSFGTFGSSSFSLTIPISSEESAVLYGKVSLLF